MERQVEAFVYGDDFKDLTAASVIKMKEALGSFDKGSRVVITVKSFYRKRLLSQNDIFHAIIGKIAQGSGLTSREVKKRMKEEFGLWEPRVDRSGNLILDSNGDMIYKTKNTSDYDTAEMAEFIDRVYAFSSNFLESKFPEKEFFKKVNIEL